jgi:hypothetical protein
MRSVTHILAIKRQKPHNLSITHLININVGVERSEFMAELTCGFFESLVLMAFAALDFTFTQ